MGIEFHPEGQAPDPDFVEVARQGRLAACFARSVLDEGVCEYVAAEVAKEWVAVTFTHREEP